MEQPKPNQSTGKVQSSQNLLDLLNQQPDNPENDVEIKSVSSLRESERDNQSQEDDRFLYRPVLKPMIEHLFKGNPVEPSEPDTGGDVAVAASALPKTK